MKVLYGMLCMMILIVSSCGSDSGFDPIKQFDKDVAAIDSYLVANNIDAYEDPSGIRFSILSLGSGGFPPKRTQTVKVDYVGRLLSNGNIFDQGILTEKLSTLIPGFIEGLEVLPVGTTAKLFIPSALGYGNEANGSIPANSILIFDVELLEVVYSTTEINQFDEDIQIIDDYIEENEIEANTDGSGVRYVVTEAGGGSVADWYDELNVTYKGKLLSDSSVFFSGTVSPELGYYTRVVDFLPGLQAGFLNIPEGSKVTLYVPSGLAFGAEGAGNSGEVPPNSIIIFEIESLEIVD